LQERDPSFGLFPLAFLNNRFDLFDMSTVNPNMLSIDQNIFEEQAAQFAFPQMQHEYDSSRARAANPQLGPRL
jgi:hypothetical protein